MIQYAKYIKTNADWLPSIPSHWKEQRVKAIFNLRNERSYRSLSDVNLISLYSRVGVIQHSDIEHTTGNRASNADGYKIVHKGDIIVNILLCWMGAIGMSTYDGVTSPAYDVYLPKSEVNSQYYHYLFRTPSFSQQCFRSGKGIMAMRWRTYSPQFCDIAVPVPPRIEQDQIVRFLDWKVSEINRLINIKRSEIHRLFQIVQQLITNEMQGEKIWLKRLLLSPLQYGANSSGTILTEGLPRYIRITDIDSNGNLKMHGAKSIELQDAKQYILEDGDILLARSGSVGKSLLYKKSYGFCAYAGYLIRARLNKKMILPEYFLYFTRSSEFEQWKDSVFIQTTIQNISADRYGRLPVPVPDIETQKRIVAKLDVVTEKIKTEIKILEKEIATLQEYKTRLISDVVTGQIDVRNIEVPEYEFVDEDNDFEADNDEELEEVEEQED